MIPRVICQCHLHGWNQNSQTLLVKTLRFPTCLILLVKKPRNFDIAKLVQLREGLINSDPNLIHKRSEEAEQGLISMEDI